MKPHRYFQIAPITIALVLGNNPTAFGQPPQNPTSKVQRVKDQVQKLGIAEDATVIDLTGKEYYGAISKIEPDSFEIAEVDLNRRMEFDYKDVKKVRKGYGRPNPFNGKRWNPLVGKIAGVAVVAGLIILAFVAVPKT